MGQPGDPDGPSGRVEPPFTILWPQRRQQYPSSLAGLAEKRCKWLHRP